MPKLVVDECFKAMLEEYGLVQTSQILQVDYRVVRRNARKVGFEVKRGRKPSKKLAERNETIRHMRAERGMQLWEIGQVYGLSAERIRQICDPRCRAYPLLEESEGNDRKMKGYKPIRRMASRATIPTDRKARSHGIPVICHR